MTFALGECGARELRCHGASDRVQRVGMGEEGPRWPRGLLLWVEAGHSSFTLHVTLRKSPCLGFSDCIHATPTFLR